MHRSEICKQSYYYVISLQSQTAARTTAVRGRTGSMFSLADSVCSSGYDSAQPDSRTVTPSDHDLQFGLAKHYGHNFVPATTPFPEDLCNCNSSASDLQIQLQEACSSYGDSVSLFSNFTTLSSYTCATCNDQLSLKSFKSTSKSCHTKSTKKERQEVESVCDDASLVIHSLKRRSDGWTGPLVKPTDPITSRLKLGRAEAIRRQEIIEVTVGRREFLDRI